MATDHSAVGHETRDTSVLGVVATLAFLAAGAAVVFVLIYGIFWYLAANPLTLAEPNPLMETEKQQFPPQPRIEVHPAIELRDLHASEDKILSTYGWTDKNASIVRIPLDRAMQLQLQRGFPVRKEGKQ
jgi:hypothetical protein